MTTTEALEYRDGEMLGALAAVRALILLHPHPREAAHQVATEMERWIAIWLGSTSASDAMLRGIDSAKRAALPSEADLDRLADG